MVLTGGGTGGHVYPGIAVARALEERARTEGEPLQTLYVGVRGRVDEQIVPKAGIPFRAVTAGQLRVASPPIFARNLLKLARGALQARTILREFRPQIVFATGGYASVPVALAARLQRLPLVVFLPDVTPGWAVRLLARLATAMATTSERALDALPRAKTHVVGYPVRDEFWRIDRLAARRDLGLAPDAKVLLVTAGSLGAARINDVVAGALPDLLRVCDVLHVTGDAGEGPMLERRTQLSAGEQKRYHVRGYLAEMPAAMIAADLMLGRAGASTLGELPAAALPAILVPGEYEGWSQMPNAEYLQAAGAAVVLRNEDLHQLADTVNALLTDPSRLTSMRAAMQSLARPNAARDLAALLWREAA